MSTIPLHNCHQEQAFQSLNIAFNDIKETLRDLKDLLTSNAVLEEQAENARKRLNALDIRVRELEISNALARGKAVFTERVIWTLVCTALAGWKFIGG